jgi:heme/copper-type cytochrome/quinol oxidase subunit 3
MSNAIPFSDQPHPITGFTNGKLGTWLFLASEVMLFGALFSAYLTIRLGSAIWPHGELNLTLGSFNTFVLLFSSFTMARSVSKLRKRDLSGFRRELFLTLILSALFLVVKGAEYRSKFALGHLPSTNGFFALYFTLTGIHALHILGGMVVNAYLVGPGAKLFQINPKQFQQRVECSAIYWYFVDAVWMILFVTLYLE